MTIRFFFFLKISFYIKDQLHNIHERAKTRNKRHSSVNTVYPKQMKENKTKQDTPTTLDNPKRSHGFHARECKLFNMALFFKCYIFFKIDLNVNEVSF